MAKQLQMRMMERVNSVVSDMYPVTKQLPVSDQQATENEIDRVETPPPDAGFIIEEEIEENDSIDFLLPNQKTDDLIIID